MSERYFITQIPLVKLSVGHFIHIILTKISTYISFQTTRGLSPLDILIKALDVVTIVIPPALPAAMTVGKLYALIRLKNYNVFCMNSRVINVSGSINCVCFDKVVEMFASHVYSIKIFDLQTGTLTEDGLDMWGVVPVVQNKMQKALKNVQSLPTYSPLVKGMASCHSLTLIDNELVGDPLDVKVILLKLQTLKPLTKMLVY